MSRAVSKARSRAVSKARSRAVSKARSLEGRDDQGRKEMAARWREWNQRRLDAQARDEDFGEPPPVDE